MKFKAKKMNSPNNNIKALSHGATFLATNSTVERYKRGKYASSLHYFANVFFTYQTVFTN